MRRTRNLHIGIDIAKKSFDVAYWKARKGEWLGRYPNDESGYEALKEQTITAIGQQRDALVKTIKAHLKRHPELQTLYRQLLGVPGIGLKSVLPMMVILYRFDSLSAGEGGKKQLTAFLGLDSQIRQSGTSVSGVPRISKRGDKQTRARLYMGVLGGIRGHNVLRDFYRLMVARGKAKKVALVACSREILHWAWAILKSGQDFDPTLAATSVGAAQP